MKKYGSFLMVFIGMCTVCSVEQELIVVPKNKKKYVSKEQCAELKVDSIVVSNEFNRSINVLRQTVDTMQKDDLDMLSDYADGEKDCFFRRAGKVELTKYYEKEMKKKENLERCNRKIQKMQQQLQLLHTELQKIQFE